MSDIINQIFNLKLESIFFLKTQIIISNIELSRNKNDIITIKQIYFNYKL